MRSVIDGSPQTLQGLVVGTCLVLNGSSPAHALRRRLGLKPPSPELRAIFEESYDVGASLRDELVKATEARPPSRKRLPS
jgi:hypothetical protein